MIESPLIADNPNPNPSKYIIREGTHKTKAAGASFWLRGRDRAMVNVAFVANESHEPCTQYLNAPALREMAELFFAMADILEMGQN